MYNILLIFALVAVCCSSPTFINQSFEESGADSGSESVETNESTSSLSFGVPNESAVSIAGGESSTDSLNLVARIGGLTTDSPSIAARFGGLSSDSPSIAARFGGLTSDSPNLAARFGGLASDSPNLAARFGGLASDSPNLAPGTGLTLATDSTASPIREIPPTASPDLVQVDKSKSPIFNIWEYAKIHGPIHVRTGGSSNDFQQTSTNGLNRCEWAIISCCQNAERGRRNSCFNALHCGGAWFGNPCSDRLQQAVYGRLLEVSPF